MRTTTTLAVLLLLAAFTGCDTTQGGGELEPPEYSLGREIIKALAEYVGEDPSDIRVRHGAWDDLSADHPDIAEAIGEYVEEAGTGVPAWTEHDIEEGARRWRAEGANPYTSLLVLMPRVPGVIHGFVRWGPSAIRIRYGGVRPGCDYVMPVDPLADGGWRIGEPEKDFSGFSAAFPWRLEDGKWVLDPQ